MPSDAEGCKEMCLPLLAFRLVARTLWRSRLLSAAAVAVALGEAGHDRGAVGGRWLRRGAERH